MGYIGHERMNRLAKERLLCTLKKINLSTYEHWLAAKVTRKPFGKGTRDEMLLQISPF